jgi:hypothetical protein
MSGVLVAVKAFHGSVLPYRHRWEEQLTREVRNLLSLKVRTTAKHTH